MPESRSATHSHTYFNSAKRLHDALIQLKRADGLNGFQVIPKVFGFANLESPNDPWPVIQSIGMLEDMIDSFTREISECDFSPDLKELYTECLPGILAALTPNGYGRAWKDIAAEIKDVYLTSLRHVDGALRQYIPERQIDSGDFEPLRLAIREASEVLDNTDLPIELRRFISSQLVAVEASIVQYRFRGSQGMREAIAGYVGSLSMYQEDLKKLPESAKLSLGKVVATMKDLLILAQTVHSAWPYLTAGATLLSHLLA